MTTIPPALPLKANEAAMLADLVYQQLEGKELTDELRESFRASLPPLGFTPIASSLSRDPVHASTYYIAITTSEPRMLIQLRIALASSPVDPEFAQAIPIGRMRPGGGREIVIEGLPLGSSHPLGKFL